MTTSNPEDLAGATIIRPCGPEDRAEILLTINAAAEAYRGVIPADRWHDTYMSEQELASEIAEGVVFIGCATPRFLVGVMGVQHRVNVDLIRHAYVLPDWQGRGIGAALIEHLRQEADRPLLVGTWAAAEWAVRFYQRQGFMLVNDDDAERLLKTYWTVPERQIAASVVLSSPELTDEAASRLIAGAAYPQRPVS